MTLRQTGWLVLLTAAYLFFELAFNARLLDVVGGNACSEEIHAIEVFGRSLSGVAVALLVLQGLLVLRNRRGTTGWGMTIALCVLAAGIVYVSLERLTDHLVASSSPEFRHASQNIVLVQRALVEKKVRLDGLTDDDAIYSRPEGKAFLALFPVMAVSVHRLEEKIRDAKLDLIRVQVSERLGDRSATTTSTPKQSSMPQSNGSASTLQEIPKLDRIRNPSEQGMERLPQGYPATWMVAIHDPGSPPGPGSA